MLTSIKMVSIPKIQMVEAVCEQVEDTDPGDILYEDLRDGKYVAYEYVATRAMRDLGVESVDKSESIKRAEEILVERHDDFNHIKNRARLE